MWNESPSLVPFGDSDNREGGRVGDRRERDYGQSVWETGKLTNSSQTGVGPDPTRTPESSPYSILPDTVSRRMLSPS